MDGTHTAGVSASLSLIRALICFSLHVLLYCHLKAETFLGRVFCRIISWLDEELRHEGIEVYER